MVKKIAKLKIELRSDLCSGSGFSYAGIIDQDIVYDKNGFPYIPGRRMKGCMREAAELFCSKEEMNQMFGKRGNVNTGCVQIENAVLEKSKELEHKIEMLKNSEHSQYFEPQSILNFYTSVRAQTKLDEKTGSALENTLRFTRVVNQTDPFAGAENLCFYANVSYFADSEAESEKIFKILKKIAKATRNIGMNRNRGLGSVRCDLIKETVQEQDFERFLHSELFGKNQVKISFCLKNVQPLILSEQDRQNTLSYISGKSILGALAGTFLRMSEDKNAADSEKFEDLFLNGTVKYANANLVFEGKRTAPAPLYLNKLKKTKKYVNILADEDNQKEVIKKDKAYDMKSGNQGKKLKTQYVVFVEKNGELSCGVTEAEKEITFHHRHAHGKDAPEALLYDLEILTPNQVFMGEIYTDKAYENEIKDLLKNTDFRFGKSKSVQYGKCELIEYPTKQKAVEQKQSFKNGDKVVVTLKSDAMFLDENGNYTVQFDAVKELLASSLNLPYKKETDEKSILQTTEISGYHTLWNMKRQAVSGASAGSAFVYTLEKDWERTPNFVGERTQEGFGEIEIYPLSLMQYKVEEIIAVLEKSKPIEALSEDMQELLTGGLRKKIIELLMLKKLESSEKTPFNASNIGRVTLMLKESLVQSQKNGTSFDTAAEDFWKRVSSIKSTELKNNAEKFLKETLSLKTIKENGKEKEYCIIDTDKICKKLEGNMVIESLKLLSPQRKETLLKGLWGDYMLQMLTLFKYKKKGE